MNALTQPSFLNFFSECNFPLEHTDVSKKSIRNISITGKSHQLKTRTLQDFPWWGTSFTWQQFSLESHLYQHITNCTSGNQTSPQGVGAVLVEVRQRREPTPGHPSSWGPAAALRAGRKGGRQRKSVTHLETKKRACGTGGGITARMRGQTKQHLLQKGQAIKGKVGSPQMSKIERHVWKDQGCLGKDREPREYYKTSEN